MRRTALIAAATGLFSGNVVAQAPDWTQVTAASSPTARVDHAMVYDSARAKLVMFGGYDGLYLNDTWEFDGVSWTQVPTATSPINLQDHSMIYDSVRGRVVMYGGWVSGFGYSDDTWEYDGVNWTQVMTASSPTSRGARGIAYDSARGKVVMFGGYLNGNLLNDTWEYDGVNWLQVATANSPTARNAHKMVFDSGRGKVVLFGGWVSGSGVYNDTWEYDGVNWIQVTTTSSPSIRTRHAMAYHSVRGKVVVFGGYSGNNVTGDLNDTWEYDGVNWTQVSIAISPAARQRHVMAYDSLRGKVLMFGGYDPNASFFNDTWGYDSVLQSSAAAYGTGCGTPALDFSPTGSPVIGAMAGALIANAPTAFAGVSMGWSDTVLTGSPLLPLSLSSIGMPGCFLLHSNDLFGLSTTPVTASTLQFDFSIPFQSSLLGAHVYLQAYCFAPGENPRHIIVSNGIDWLIGSQ